MATDFLLHGHEYMYDLDWLVKVVKRHSDELAQIDQKIADAIKIGLTDERIKSIVEDIISNASGVVNVKIPPAELTPATGDGTANDTAAIQGCIDYVAAKGGGIVFLPPGKYLVNDLTLQNYVGLVGMGRYATTLYAAGGSKQFVVGGVCTAVSICNLGINGNATNQVADIDGIQLAGSDYLLSGVLITNTYEGIQITLSEPHTQITDVVIDGCGVKGLSVTGGQDVQMENVQIYKVSSVTGVCVMEIASLKTSANNILLDSSVPSGLVVNNDDLDFTGRIIGPAVPVVDNGHNNTIRVVGVSKKENWSESVVENTGSLTVNASSTNLVGGTANVEMSGDVRMQQNNLTVEGQNFDINIAKNIGYQEPTTWNQYFSYINFQTLNGGVYPVLVGTENTPKLDVFNLASLRGNILTVGRNNQMFQTINDAIAYARTFCSADNRALIWIAPGTYNEEIVLTPNPGIDFIGYGAKIEMALNGPRAPFRCIGKCFVAGIYFSNNAPISDQRGYAVHVEAQDVLDPNFIRGEMTFYDCFFQSVSHAGMGAGLGDAIYLRVFNCLFYTSSEICALYIHNYPGTSGFQSAEFYGCMFNGGNTNVIIEDAAHMRGNNNSSPMAMTFANCSGSIYKMSIQTSDNEIYTNFREAESHNTNISLNKISKNNEGLPGANFHMGYFITRACPQVIAGECYFPTPVYSSWYTVVINKIVDQNNSPVSQYNVELNECSCHVFGLPEGVTAINVEVSIKCN